MSAQTRFQDRCEANLERVTYSLEELSDRGGYAADVRTLTALKRAYEECLKNEGCACANHVRRKFEAEDAWGDLETESFEYVDWDPDMYNWCLTEMAKLRKIVVECEEAIVRMFS